MNRKEAYIIAVENEIRAINLYSILAKSFQDEDLVGVFKSLSQLEKGHQEKIEESYRKEFGDTPFDYNKEALPRFEVKDDLSDPRQVLRYAITKEEDMKENYQKMAAESQQDEIKSFFHDLAAEEQNHKELLEAELNRIEGTMVWFDASELNGLMEY